MQSFFYSRLLRKNKTLFYFARFKEKKGDVSLSCGTIGST